MPNIELSNVWSRPLQGVSLSASSGCHVVLHQSEAGGAELIRLLAGMVHPERGLIRIDGQAPHTSPTLRAHVGALLATEPPLPGKQLEEALASALSSRKFGSGFTQEILQRAQLSGLTLAAPASLSPEECRKLALIIALSTPSAKLIALFEPLMFSDADFREQALEWITTLALTLPVLCVTASTATAFSLGGSQFSLNSHGVLTPNGAPAQASQGFSIECVDARKLASALSEQAAVMEVHWSQTQTLGTVVALGPDTLALTRGIAHAVLDTATQVASIRPLRDSPSGAVPHEQRT